MLRIVAASTDMTMVEHDIRNSSVIDMLLFIIWIVATTGLLKLGFHCNDMCDQS